MSARYLVIRRRGSLWGVPNERVEAVFSALEGFRVRLTEDDGGTTDLAADEVVGLSEELAVRPPLAVLTRYWSERPAGCGVLAGAPILVLDPRRTPRWLEFSEGGQTDVEAD